MANRSQTGDHDLVVACMSGSQDAWNAFYGRFKGLIRSVVIRKLRPYSRDWDDVTQDVFVKLVPALAAFNSDVPLARFVCMIAERVCIDHYRSVTADRRNVETQPTDTVDSDQDGFTPLVSQLESPDDEVSRAQMVNYLRLAVRELLDDCRTLIKMRYLEELEVKDIAASLGRAPNTVTVQIRRCLEQLKGILHQVQRRR